MLRSGTAANVRNRDKKKCLFWVAHPKFEDNKCGQIIEVDIDEGYVNESVTQLNHFWETYVLKNIFQTIHYDK